jgi:hypothetical protein
MSRTIEPLRTPIIATPAAAIPPRAPACMTMRLFGPGVIAATTSAQMTGRAELIAIDLAL